MCLAIPGKVLEIDRSATPLMGTVSFGGVEKRICMEWLPEVAAGDYVIVHVGFAISKMDEEEAMETLRILREAGELWDESRRPGETPPEPPGTSPDTSS